MKQFIDVVNRYAPTLTLVGALCAFIWAAGRWSAQFEVVREDLQKLTGSVETVQTDVRSVQETLRHFGSCVYELHQRTRRVAAGIPEDIAGAVSPRPFDIPMSCTQAIQLASPTQGD